VGRIDLRGEGARVEPPLRGEDGEAADAAAAEPVEVGSRSAS
jgi:hypothetical protein